MSAWSFSRLVVVRLRWEAHRVEGYTCRPPNLGGRCAESGSMRHAHHAVAETLHLQAAGPAPPLALVLLLADVVAAGLLQRRVILSCVGLRRGLRRNRQRKQGNPQGQRPETSHQRNHVIAPYIKLA